MGGVRYFRGADGTELAYRELGVGRPLIALHGFMGASTQWIEQGPAPVLAERGHRVLLPDLRGHGDSARPHDPARYPPDVLVDDGFALIAALGLEDYDLAGYSLGGYLAARLLLRGARPARAVLGGQGTDVFTGSSERTDRYRDTLRTLAAGDTPEPGSPQAKQAYWIDRLGGDPQALLHVQDSLVTASENTLRAIDTPTLVMVGTDDRRRHTAAELATLLPNATLRTVPGDHVTALGSSAFAETMSAFLADPVPRRR